MTRNVFVLPLDEFNRRLLGPIEADGRYRFHALLEFAELSQAKSYPMQELLERAEQQLRAFPGRVDGLMPIYDFPSSLMAPLLRRRLDLPGPSLESVLRCEHKYWSRLEQRRAVPELVPRFCPVDPFAGDSLAVLDIETPFWLKPICAHSSHLGFLIEDERDYRAALEQIRRGLPRFAEPFNVLLGEAALPPEVAVVDGFHCLAEQIISAPAQCTLEGYVFAGEPHIYGIVDSLREEGRPSFSRYRYPSTLPETLQERMKAAAAKVMRQLGFDGGPFNLEFFHDPQSDRLWLLEINARISKSHCPLFAMVEGRSHHQVAADLAVGERPHYPPGGGRFACATKFMLRRYEDGLVAAVPNEDQLARLRREQPETGVVVLVKPGDRLAELEEQDSYSYEYADLFIGGSDERELQEKYRRCLELLRFELVPP